MSITFLDDSELESSESHAINIVDVGDKILPYNELSPEGFEHLLYAIYKKQNNRFYDQVTLMVTGADKGRDVWLTRAQIPSGLVQCKREKQGFDAIKSLREIIKFLLFAHLEPKLLPIPSDFTYTLALSSEPAGTTVDFFTHPIKWIEDHADKIEPNIQKVINQYSTFSTIKLEAVAAEIISHLQTIQYELVRPVDLNEWLNELPSIKTRFFRQNTSIDIDATLKSLISQLSLQQTGLPSATQSNLAITSTTLLSSMESVPLPKSLASRKRLVQSIYDSILENGVGWIFGAAGVGKTVAAKMAAKKLGGDWSSLNLRGRKPEEVHDLLMKSVGLITQQHLSGILVDDLSTDFEPMVIDALVALFNTCQNYNTCLLFTSSKKADSDFLFNTNLSEKIEQRVGDFSEEDLREILDAYNVKPYWVKYIHLVSGGGHPQLAAATIQSMQANNWDLKELHTLKSLVEGNEAIENVRKRTRSRLLKDLDQPVRTLIERLSVFSGRFKKQLVLDLARIPPQVNEAGLIFEQIIGSWIDQNDVDSFLLSPLLTNYAKATLSERERHDIHYQIADSLVLGKTSLDPLEVNSACLSAIISGNESVLVIISVGIILTEYDTLKQIAPYLSFLSFFNVRTPIYKGNKFINQSLRAAQVLILSAQDDKKHELKEALALFGEECNDEGAGERTALLKIAIYSKLLLSPHNFLHILDLKPILKETEILLSNQRSSLIEEDVQNKPDFEIMSAIGLMIINQAASIRKIDDLIPFFELINCLNDDSKEQLFSVLKHNDFSSSTLISHAWLSEEKVGTIDIEKHSQVFLTLEKLSSQWKNYDLAVTCREFASVIIDETAKQTSDALELISEGFEIYGHDNQNLLRAKARILFRAKEYAESLDVSKKLLEMDVTLNRIEKAHLCREAAICAEELGNFELAYKLFLAGKYSDDSDFFDEMKVMNVALLADASFAAWKQGNYQKSLLGFKHVLQEVESIDPNESLRASHCHATIRHVLLWMEQDITGRAHSHSDTEDTVVYPGIVSNPSPIKEIGNFVIAPLNSAWYMLAMLEVYTSLDVGIAEALTSNLNGRVIGSSELILTYARLEKAINESNVDLFVTTIEHLYLVLTHVQSPDAGLETDVFRYLDSFGSITVDFSRFSYTTERLLLEFLVICSLTGKKQCLERITNKIHDKFNNIVRDSFTFALEGKGGDASDDILYLAQHIASLKNARPSRQLTPTEVFKHAYISTWILSECSKSNLHFRTVFEWFGEQWQVVWQNQRASLIMPQFYFSDINKAITPQGNNWGKSLVNLLTAVLPTLGVRDEFSVMKNLRRISEKISLA